MTVRVLSTAEMQEQADEYASRFGQLDAMGNRADADSVVDSAGSEVVAGSVVDGRGPQARRRFFSGA